jgi:ATP-dependent exoDNAse (exonuclease V) beta subunit
MLWPLDFAVAPPPEPGQDDAAAQRLAPAAPPPFMRLPEGYASPPMPADVEAPATPVRERAALAYDWAGADAAAIGTVVHRALAALARADRLDADGVAPLAMRARFEAELAALGVGGGALDDAAARVESALARTLRDPRGRWLFDPTHDEAASELALTTRVDGEVRRIAIDRTFVADGERWIVDFKTSRHEGGDLEAFLASERMRHAPQLERYARALAAIDARPIRLALYYPLLGRLDDWRYAR